MAWINQWLILWCPTERLGRLPVVLCRCNHQRILSSGSGVDNRRIGSIESGAFIWIALVSTRCRISLWHDRWSEAQAGLFLHSEPLIKVKHHSCSDVFSYRSSVRFDWTVLLSERVRNEKLRFFGLFPTKWRNSNWPRFALWLARGYGKT